MAFRFETANERWQWFSMGGGDPEDHAGEWQFPEQTSTAIRKRMQEGATMDQIKQEFAKFISENNLSDNDIYGIGTKTAADPSEPQSKFVIYPCKYHEPQRGATFDEGSLDYGDVYLEEGGRQTLVKRCEGCSQGLPPTNQDF